MQSYQSCRKCFTMQFYTNEYLMTVQRKKNNTQKYLILKRQKYSILPAHIFSWHKIVRKQITTQNSIE